MFVLSWFLKKRKVLFKHMMFEQSLICYCSGIRHKKKKRNVHLLEYTWQSESIIEIYDDRTKLIFEKTEAIVLRLDIKRKKRNVHLLEYTWHSESIIEIYDVETKFDFWIMKQVQVTLEILCYYSEYFKTDSIFINLCTERVFEDETG